ncbi:MAG TPA: hypothetical protein DCL61_19255 [Cyanobacteria bacterium UBA12227]|nr:hypothetical protein [Cyanobacteria bacterium UBA12227]
MRHFLITAIALVFGFFAAIALSHVPRGLTVPADVGMNTTVNLNVENPVAVERYQVSGDRLGRVMVKDTLTGEVVRTFEMDEGVFVRETFLLDNNQTIAVSQIVLVNPPDLVPQKNRTLFWDLATGREIARIDQRVYGFNHDETKFFTQNGEGVFLYSYPDLKPICKLTKQPEAGTQIFRFSPDGKFLFIQFHSGYTAGAQGLPDPLPIVDASAVYTKLFNLQNCREIQEFSAHRSHVSAVQFSEDSKFLYLENLLIYLDGIRQEGNWRFNLESYQFEKLDQ